MTQRTERFLLRHALAALASLITISAVTSGAYFLLVVFGAVLYGDIGGPLNFVLVPVGAVAFAIASCIISFLVAVLLENLRDKWHFAWWFPTALLFFGTGGFFYAGVSSLEEGASHSVLIQAAVLGAIPAFCFSTYWIPLLIAHRVQRRTHESFFPQ